MQPLQLPLKLMQDPASIQQQGDEIAALRQELEQRTASASASEALACLESDE